jgi:hypothetical protein
MKNNFSNIEQELKAEAANNLPEFNEDAWHKMEALLDKDKRRPKIIFWLSGIALIVLLFTAIYVMTRNNEPGTMKDNKIADNKTSKEKLQLATGTIIDKNKEINDKHSVDTHTVNPQNFNKSNGKVSIGLPVQNSRSFINPSRTNSAADKRVDVNNQVEKTMIASSNDVGVPEQEEGLPEKAPAEEAEKLKNEDRLAEEVLPNILPADSGANKTKDKMEKKSGIYVTGFVGMGTDRTTWGNASKLTPKYGLGLGFAINDKWSVAVGIRRHKKIYTAGANDYKAKSGYWSMVDIQKVNADCIVYEIPLTVNYNLMEKNGYRIFGSAGVSSLIMKNEQYDFSYINTSGQAAKGSSSYTGNKHYFSTVNLGAGVSKKLNKRIHIFASPALSLPIKGIGEGAIKLKSFEIMCGINYFPFK